MPSFIRAAGAWLFFMLPLFILAQEKGPVNIRMGQQRVDDSTVMLHFDLSIQKGVKLFQLQQKPEDALYSEISFDSSSLPLISRKSTEEGSLRREVDPALEAEVGYYTDSVRWMQALRVQAGDSTVVKGSLRFMYKSGDQFLNGEEPFAFYIRRGVSSAAELRPEGPSVPAAGSGGVGNRSLWWIFLAAFGGGLLALLTPCVYSMIPVTVSFFTKRSTDRKEGIRNALLYAGSIVVIFTLLGFLITLVFGPAALNNLATNWIANLVFFALFLVFGISFLGAFDINLPASWMNKTDARGVRVISWGSSSWPSPSCWFRFPVRAPSSETCWCLPRREVTWAPW